MKSAEDGFTLVELLIVVAVIGVIVAIAIPNLLSSLQRSKQKRTMADLRAVAVALELYQTDHSRYPATTDGTVASIRSSLEPIYASTVPWTDGWGRPFQYAAGPDQYTVLSLGRNGASDTPYVYGPTDSFKADIVYSDGTFLQWPEGVQSGE